MAAAPQPSTGPSGYAHLDKDPRRQKILCVGARGAGKTSALKILLHNASVRSAMLGFGPTYNLIGEDVDIFAPLQVWDSPGMSLAAGKENPFVELPKAGLDLADFSVMIWFLDFRGSPNKYIGYIAKAFLEAAKANPRIKLALFVHKLDHFATDPDTYRQEFANLQEAIEEEFDELIQDGDPEPQPTYHTTSITDTSLQLAFSQVLTSTLMASTAISGILDSWVTASKLAVQRCFLFDKVTKLYVANDNSSESKALHSACVEWLYRISALEELYEPIVARQIKTVPPTPREVLERFTSAEGNGDVEYESDRESVDSEDEIAEDAVDDDDDEDQMAEEFPSQSMSTTNNSAMKYFEITPRLAIVCKVHCSLYDSSREGIEERFEHVRDGVRRILDAQVQLRSGN